MPKAALLLDADNLSSASDVDQAFRYFEAKGLSVSVRRAYGGHDKLSGLKDVLRGHAMRAFINQGKGTTDVALVVDVMDLLHNGSLPSTIGVASSDADFSPLALRLREAGLWVVCFARREKADADALALVYDEVIYVDVEPPRPAARKAPVPAPVAKAPPAVKKTPAKKVAAKKTGSAAAPAAKAVARPVGIASADVAVQDILEVVPSLRSGNSVAMNDVVKRLRDAALLSRQGKLATLLRKFGGEFQLLPEASPTQVRWVAGRS